MPEIDFSFLSIFLTICLVVFIIGFMIAALPGWAWFVILFIIIVSSVFGSKT